MGKRKPDWEHLTQEDYVKLEIAEELGLLDKIRKGGYGELTAQESGRVGGILGSRRRKQRKKAAEACAEEAPREKSCRTRWGCTATNTAME